MTGPNSFLKKQAEEKKRRRRRLLEEFSIRAKHRSPPASFEPIWGRENGLWLHSDIKNMAFFYNYEFFYSVLNEE